MAQAGRSAVTAGPGSLLSCSTTSGAELDQPACDPAGAELGSAAGVRQRRALFEGGGARRARHADLHLDGEGQDDPNRMRYPTELYVKSPEEMRELFDRRTTRWRARRVGGAGQHGARSRSGAMSSWIGRTTRRWWWCARRALPKHSVRGVRGDLTAWFKAFCAEFELEPFDRPGWTDSPSSRRSATGRCGCCARRGWSGGTGRGSWTATARGGSRGRGRRGAARGEVRQVGAAEP